MTAEPLDDDYRMPPNPKPRYCSQCDNKVGEDETLCLECREDAEEIAARCVGGGNVNHQFRHPTNTTSTDAIDLRFVLLLNEAYVFLGMPHKKLHPWRVALDDWQRRVEAETGWRHFEEAQKFERNRVERERP